MSDNTSKAPTTPQRRASDFENAPWVDELTSFEKFIRRMAAQKKAIGMFLLGCSGAFLPVAVAYQAKWMLVLNAVLSAAGGALVAGGSTTIKSDDYDRAKNDMLKRTGAM